ncbi:hypothetical protein SAMN05216302_10644 [Nitrosomonas aestuarii]|uniref:Uncharacterized protein n=1 Tax=Nitrosomonas aestuarii TaxID=52441 RepID=A0A1I4GX15_9PROT|nr:hypothetical protein SAMN05216302_10644 [Nitrosomonas aestuarii]
MSNYKESMNDLNRKIRNRSLKDIICTSVLTLQIFQGDLSMLVCVLTSLSMAVVPDISRDILCL